MRKASSHGTPMFDHSTTGVSVEFLRTPTTERKLPVQSQMIQKDDFYTQDYISKVQPVSYHRK